MGNVISGSMVVRHNDRAEETLVAGEVFLIQPGHDGWVVGDQPCVAQEFNSVWTWDLRP